MFHTYLMLLLSGVKNTLERTKKRRLEQHGRHFAIPRDPVQHLDDAMVGVGQVLLKLRQEQAAGLNHSIVGKSGHKIKLHHNLETISGLLLLSTGLRSAAYV
jgi:hypothetical protein